MQTFQYFHSCKHSHIIHTTLIILPHNHNQTRFLRQDMAFRQLVTDVNFHRNWYFGICHLHIILSWSHTFITHYINTKHSLFPNVTTLFAHVHATLISLLSRHADPCDIFISTVEMAPYIYSWLLHVCVCNIFHQYCWNVCVCATLSSVLLKCLCVCNTFTSTAGMTLYIDSTVCVQHFHQHGWHDTIYRLHCVCAGMYDQYYWNDATFYYSWNHKCLHPPKQPPKSSTAKRSRLNVALNIPV